MRTKPYGFSELRLLLIVRHETTRPVAQAGRGLQYVERTARPPSVTAEESYRLVGYVLAQLRK